MNRSSAGIVGARNAAMLAARSAAAEPGGSLSATRALPGVRWQNAATARSTRSRAACMRGDPPRDRRRGDRRAVTTRELRLARRQQEQHRQPDVARQHPAGHRAEADPRRRRRRCRRADRDLVAVLEERARRAVGEGDRLGAVPGQLEERAALVDARRRDTVPDANRSPVRSEAPLTVRCASCWAGVQYIVGERRPRHDRAVPAAPRATRSRPQPVVVAQVGQHLRILRAAPATRAASSASSGTTHGDTEVANDLPRNGPSGTYSQAWMSRAVQSLTQAHPEDVLAERGGRHRRAARATACRRRSRPRPRCRDGATGRTSGVGVRGCLALAARSHDVGAGDDDGAGAAVVADREVLPVRRERVGVGAEDARRRSRRGARRSRSRRSRRPRTAGAASPSAAGCRWRSTSPRSAGSVSSSVSRDRTADQAGRPSARKALRLAASKT